MNTNKSMKKLRLPPDPEEMNDDRAEWAMAGVEAFADETGVSIEYDGLDTAISDLLANLGHLCDRQGLELCDLLASAAGHYNEETAGKGKQFAGVGVTL